LSAGNLLQVNSGSTLTAGNSFILLREANTATGQIVVQGGPTTLQTTGTGGAVTMIIGTTVPTPIAGVKPANLTVNNISGGQAFFGTNSISVPNAPATVNLKGSNVQFSTGARPATAIVLGPGVTITADPIGSTTPQAQLYQVQSVLPNATTVPADAQPSLKGEGPLSVPASSFQTGGVPMSMTSSGFQAAVGQAPASQFMSADNVHAAVNPANNTLSANGGFISAVNGASITSALGGNVINSAAKNDGTSIGTTINVNGVSVTTPQVSAPVSDLNTVPATTSTTTNSAAAAWNSARAVEGYWMSDTELVTGKIPAVLNSDEDMGVSQDVSTVVELEDEDLFAPKVDRLIAQPGQPLQGSVTHTASGVKQVHLKRGSVVFAPLRDTVVHTEFGDVKVGAKSVVLMMSFRHGLAVFDLDDTHLKAVTVKAGDNEVVLAPGMQTVITKDSVSGFEQVNPAQMIGYRTITERALGNGLKAYMSEFCYRTQYRL